MKLIMLVLAGLLVFVGTVVGALAATGNLNQSSIDALMGKEVTPVNADGIPVNAPKTSEARELQQQREQLTARAKTLDEREAQLNIREQNLQQLQQEIDGKIDQLGGSLEEAEQKRKERLMSAVNTLQEMKADAAADAIKRYPIEDQAEMLNMITKDKDRAKILEAMDPEDTARVLKAMAQ